MEMKKKLALFDRDSTYSLKGIAISAIILHHCYQGVVGSMSLNYYSPLLSVYIGSYAVALFFMLSGYGMFLSMRRNRLTSKYLISHLGKLYIPFLSIYFLRFLVFLLFGIITFNYKLLFSFLYLDLPCDPNWFMKVIFGAYVVSFWVLKYVKNDFIAITLVTIFSIIYFKLAKNFGLDGYWYFTILNFSVGMILAKVKKFKYFNYFPILPFSVVFGFFFRDNTPLLGIFISLFLLSLAQYVNLNSSILKYMGNNSWLFYLSHGIFLVIYPKIFDNYFIYPFFVFGGSALLVFVYNWLYRISITKLM